MPAEWCLAGFFVTWLGLTAVSQMTTPWAQRIAGWDEVGLLPVSRFFAPVPGNVDYHVVYRDVTADGELTTWKELTPPRERSKWAPLWNPGKRRVKGLHDVVTTLARVHAETGADDLVVSVPYLVLLTYVSTIPRSVPALKTQFAIFLSSGRTPAEPPALLVASRLHRL